MISSYAEYSVCADYRISVQNTWLAIRAQSCNHDYSDFKA